MARPIFTSRRNLLRWILLLVFSISLIFTLQATLFRSSLPKQASTPNKLQTPISSFRKELVVASLKGDDTSWMQEYLPDWKANIYIVNDATAELTVPKNKGREAMVYLTFLIENYDRLPNIMVFIHSLRYQWHNDEPIYDGLPMIRNLQLPYIISQGYINLRCVWTLGCPAELQFNRDSTDRPTEAAYPKAFQELFPGQPVPGTVGVACCAQFALTQEKVHERPLKDYQHYRKWLMETDLEDATSGRVMEYSWHMIFGRPAVHCPNASECYCLTFGLCNLTCTADKCGERWPFPPYATLPPGWPQVGWNGEHRSQELLAALQNNSMTLPS